MSWTDCCREERTTGIPDGLIRTATKSSPNPLFHIQVATNTLIMLLTKTDFKGSQPGKGRVAVTLPELQNRNYCCARIPRSAVIFKPWIQFPSARLLNSSEETFRGFEDLC